jgi:putative zinc finger protein
MSAGILYCRKLAKESEKSCHLFCKEDSHLFGRFGISEMPWTGGVVEISCLEVIRELSNYIDKDVTKQLREQIVAHLPGCSHCTAIFDGLKNTIMLTADGRAFHIPAGFSQRLRAKLGKQ